MRNAASEFDDVDGILGFGWGGDFLKSAAILNTLASRCVCVRARACVRVRSPPSFTRLCCSARPEWHIEQAKDYVPMPRMFAFTASDAGAELQVSRVTRVCVTYV